MAQGPPAGITLDSMPHDAASATTQGLPPGITLDSAPHDSGHGAGGSWDSAPGVLPPYIEQGVNTIPGGQMVVGAGKGLLDTTAGIGELIHDIPGVGPKLIPESGLQNEENAAKIDSNHAISQGIGKFGENVAEWAAGEEGLKALGTVAKVAHMSPEMIQFLEKYPKATKAILGVLKPAAVGAVQGGVKGASSETGAVTGAEQGALGGAVAGGATELGAPVVKAVGKTVGLGTTSFEDAMRAAKPSKWNTKFIQDWQTAAPRLSKILDAEGKFSNMDEAAGRIREAANDIWSQEVQPIIKNHATEAVNTDPVYDAVRAKITPSMQKFNPEGAKVIDKIANEYNPSKVLSVQELESDLEHLNSELKATGFYSKPSEEQAAMLKVNPQIAAWDAAAGGIREQLYSHLSAQGENIEELKNAYGAMSNVAKSVKGQVNVAGRQVPISLKQAIGLAAGISHGGATGAIAALMPIVDKLYNDPTALLNRAIGKSAGPGLAEQAAPVAGAAIKTATAQPVGTWVRMMMNGKPVEVHPEDVSEAQKRGATKAE